MAKGRVYRRGTIRSLTKPKRKEKPHHWMKAKAIAAYLNRRETWAIFLKFEDTIVLSELISITAPGSIFESYVDSLGFIETLNFASSLDKADVVSILEDVSLSLAREATTDSFSVGDVLTTNFNSVINDTTADGVTFTEQLDFLFELTATQDSLSLTDVYSNHLTKALVDGFALDETLEILDKESILNKGNVISFATDIQTFSVGKGFSEDVTVAETLGKTIFKTFSDGVGVAESIGSKVFTISKSDGVTIDHAESADVVISGTFANRKLGGEPFNKLTFN